MSTVQTPDIESSDPDDSSDTSSTSDQITIVAESPSLGTLVLSDTPEANDPQVVAQNVMEPTPHEVGFNPVSLLIVV